MPQVEYRGMLLMVPDNDSEFGGYFEAAREHRLVVKKCAACGLLRFPPGSGCPWCTSLDWTWQDVSGKGIIYSYEIIAHAIQPGFRDFTPYPVIIVELDEQRGVPDRSSASPASRPWGRFGSFRVEDGRRLQVGWIGRRCIPTNPLR